MRVLKDCEVTENPLDAHYKALHCELRLMNKTDAMFKVQQHWLSTADSSQNCVQQQSDTDCLSGILCLTLKSYCSYISGAIDVCICSDTAVFLSLHYIKMLD